MHRILLLPLILLLAVAMPIVGCGDDTETTSATGEDTETATTASASATVEDGETTAAIPDDVDFEAIGAELVAAAATGDCDTFADLQGWSEEGQNRDTSIANCELVTAELSGPGEPVATSTRMEGLADDEVQVWVTREYADGSTWEMQMVIRNSTASNRDEGWVVSTFSY